MKKLFFLCSLFAATFAQALTVAAYNVENYLLADRMADGVYRKAYPKPQTEKTALSKVVAAIAPDILAVEEMGTQAFLDDFQRELKQTGQDFPYTALVQSADADRHVALLSKVPFKEVKQYTKVSTTYFGAKDVVKRGVLEAVISTSEGDLSIFVIHLKSKRTERPDDPESTLQRQEEARAVRDLVFTRYPDPTKAKFIVCGDWNDTRSSKPVQTLIKRGDTKLGELLRASDSRGETWTHYYRREDSYSRIDYILVSPALLPFVAGKEAKIYDGENSTVGSDHRAIYAKLNLEPAK